MTQSLQAQVKRREKKLLKIASVEIPRAASRALNDVASKSKTLLVRKIASETKVQSKHIRKRVFVKRSNPKTLKSFVTAYASDIPAVSLLPSKTLLAKARRGTNRKGVRVAGRQFNGAFINVVRRSGRFQVLKRRRTSRYPLDVVIIPVKEKIKRLAPEIIESTRRTVYQTNYLRELDYRLKKYEVR